jgi:hypothetical protein
MAAVATSSAIPAKAAKRSGRGNAEASDALGWGADGCRWMRPVWPRRLMALSFFHD